MTKRKSIGYIYMFTNRINGKKYIGQHEFKEGIDENYFGSGYIFANAKEKYGIENFKFDILCWCNSKEELDNAESYFIGFKYYTYANTGRGYNIADGGNGGNLLRGKTEEEMKEIAKKKSVKMTGEKHPMYGKHHTKKSREKMSEAWNNKTEEEKKEWKRKKSEAWNNKTEEEMKEIAKKISEAVKGEKNPMYGKHHTKKSREKISEAWNNKTEEEKKEWKRKKSEAWNNKTEEEMKEIAKKISEAVKGEKHPSARKVRCLEEGKVFNTIKEACEWAGLKSSASIIFCCQGKRKVAGGYHWEYVN